MFILDDSEGDQQPKHHLDDLETGGHHGEHLGHLDPHGTERVVGVHHGVDAEVHHHEQSAGGGDVDVGEEAHPHDSNVMIPVKKYQFLFSQNNKSCVKQFHHLELIMINK